MENNKQYGTFQTIHDLNMLPGCWTIITICVEIFQPHKQVKLPGNYREITGRK